MTDKLISSIDKDTKLTDPKCRSIYGRTQDDETFLPKLRDKLQEVERHDIAEQYNKWLVSFKREKDKQDREVSRWLSARINNWYDGEVKKAERIRHARREVERCNKELVNRKEQLLRKKLQLLKKRLHS